MTDTSTTQKPKRHIHWISPESDYDSHGPKANIDLFQPFIDELDKHAETGVTAEALARYACIAHDFDAFSTHREPESHFIYAFIRENLIPHKIEVLKECIKIAVSLAEDPMGLLESAIKHDLSKLHPRELFTYSQIHYEGGINKYLNPVSENHIPIDRFASQAAKTRKDKMDMCFHHHYQANDHHPEHWVIGGEPRKMDKWASYEMVADWAAASTTYGTPLQQWVDANFEKKPLHPDTRWHVKYILSEVYNIKFVD